MARLREIKKLFHIIEIFVALFLLTWAAARVPSAVRISGEYFRRLITAVLSHLFIFFLSNTIVLTLFFNSRNLFPQQNFQNLSELMTTHMDFCQEFIKNNAGGGGGAATHVAGESSPAQAGEFVYEDKQTILEVTKAKVQRSRSENFRRGKSLELEGCDKCCGCGKQLRRSETERWRRVEETAAAENVEEVDELSNEEFQKMIEAFIAKQIKFHREEKLAIVLHGCT